MSGGCQFWIVVPWCETEVAVVMSRLVVGIPQTPEDGEKELTAAMMLVLYMSTDFVRFR